MIRCLKRSTAPVAALFESLPKGGLDFFSHRPIAVYEISDLKSHRCLDLVDLFKQYAVIGVVEQDVDNAEWGSEFCALATCFYTTGFRPLLLDFLGTPSLEDLQEIFAILRRSYRMGWVDRPVIRLGGLKNAAEKDNLDIGRRAGG